MAETQLDLDMSKPWPDGGRTLTVRGLRKLLQHTDLDDDVPVIFCTHDEEAREIVEYPIVDACLNKGRLVLLTPSMQRLIDEHHRH